MAILNSSLGWHFTDTGLFTRVVSNGVTTNGVAIEDGVGRKFSGEAAFYSQSVPRLGGVAVDSNFSADTYKTILNQATGPGVMWGAVSPAISNGADTITMRITRDGGTAVTIAVAPGTVSYRLFLGSFTDRATFTTAGIGFDVANMQNDTSSKAFYNAGTNSPVFVPSWSGARGVGGLYFSSSLLVEMKVTNAVSATANQERQAAVIYTMGLS